MGLDELNLTRSHEEKLAEAGIHTVADVLDAGLDGLVAINGIGPKTASEILAAATAISTGEQAAGAGKREADPNEWVTVRNISDAMVLVGERYLLPGQRRVVLRRQIRHIGTDKLEVQ